MIDIDKTLLHIFIENWKILFKHDFEIKSFRVKQLSQCETFSFSQARSVLKYFDIKIACLYITEVDDEDMQCFEIREELRNPEYHSIIHLKFAGNILAWLCQELIDTKSDSRVLWQKSQQHSFIWFINIPHHIEACQNDFARKQLRDRGNWRECTREYKRDDNDRFEDLIKDCLAIITFASQNSPRSCRFYDDFHWDKEYNYYKSNAITYHYYQLDMSEEKYTQMKEEYEYL